MSQSIADVLEYSTQAKGLILTLLKENNFERDLSIKVFLSYLAIVLEHQKAVIVLVSLQLAGSARALFRCQFEAVYRGLWVLLVAREDEIRMLLENQQNVIPAFAKMAKEIEEILPGLNFVEMSKNWKHLCALSHTGIEQLVHQIQSDGAIRAIYPWQEVKWCVESSGVVSILMAQVFFQVVGQYSKFVALSDFCKRYEWVGKTETGSPHDVEKKANS